MNTDRIKTIQDNTAHPDSISVQQALLQVWNECDSNIEEKINIGIEEFLHEAARELMLELDAARNTHELDAVLYTPPANPMSLDEYLSQYWDQLGEFNRGKILYLLYLFDVV